MIFQPAWINKKLPKCHIIDFTMFGVGVSQGAYKPPVLSENWKHTRGAKSLPARNHCSWCVCGGGVSLDCFWPLRGINFLFCGFSSHKFVKVGVWFALSIHAMHAQSYIINYQAKGLDEKGTQLWNAQNLKNNVSFKEKIRTHNISACVALTESLFDVLDHPAEDWEQPLRKRLQRKWWYGIAPDVQNAKVALHTSFSHNL